MTQITQRQDYQRVIAALSPHPATATIALDAALQGLARLGTQLRKRYENECSYDWACTSKYETETAQIELKARQMAERAGLHIFLQGDCRGATVYVSREPIASNDYNRQGAFCLYFKD